jgi:hypothetical protein
MQERQLALLAIIVVWVGAAPAAVEASDPEIRSLVPRAQQSRPAPAPAKRRPVRRPRRVEPEEEEDPPVLAPPRMALPRPARSPSPSPTPSSPPSPTSASPAAPSRLDLLLQEKRERARLVPVVPTVPDLRGRWRYSRGGGRCQGVIVLTSQDPDGRISGTFSESEGRSGRIEGRAFKDHVECTFAIRVLVLKVRIYARASFVPGQVVKSCAGTWGGWNPHDMPRDFEASRLD